VSNYEVINPYMSKAFASTVMLNKKTDKQKTHNSYKLWVLYVGRDGGIRTHDPLHPMQVRYQAALRPEA
jgi:hypothetical protein